jgi:NTE family protein
MFGRLLAPLSIKHFFHHVSDALSLGGDLRDDLSLLRALGGLVLPLPEAAPPVDDPFGPARPFEVPALAGKKVGIVATGGGGAMVCSVGVLRACEEAGLEVAGISTCSGSAMALAPIAAGLDAQQTARWMLGWRREDYLEPDWSQLLKIPLALGRGFAGLIPTEAIERLYTRRLGQPPVGQLPIPFYANIWDLDRNRLLYLGSRTRPELSLPLLVRAAVTLPLFMIPLELDGAQCGDGGVVNIFPVDPLVDHHPEIDFYIGVNAFYPENFAGEDHTGWHRQTFSILRVTPQTQQCQHIEAARMQLRRIQDRCLMVHPLHYHEYRGVKLYEHFVDRSQWADFMRRGHLEARRALEGL